jgi:hypothetical protein
MKDIQNSTGSSRRNIEQAPTATGNDHDHNGPDMSPFVGNDR